MGLSGGGEWRVRGWSCSSWGVMPRDVRRARSVVSRWTGRGALVAPVASPTDRSLQAPIGRVRWPASATPAACSRPAAMSAGPGSRRATSWRMHPTSRRSTPSPPSPAGASTARSAASAHPRRGCDPVSQSLPDQPYSDGQLEGGPRAIGRQDFGWRAARCQRQATAVSERERAPTGERAHCAGQLCIGL